MATTTQQGSSLLKYLQVIFFSAVLLYFGRTLFIPLFFGLLIAIVLYPVCRWFEKHGWSRPLAITVCLLIVAVLFGSLLAILAWQIEVFSKDAPAILQKLETAWQGFQVWLQTNTGLSIGEKQQLTDNLANKTGGVLQSALQTTLGTLVILFLTPVYTALFMFHRKVLVQYLKMITPNRYQHELDLILQQTVHTYYNYIKGMVLVYLIVGILNSIGLFALGVKNPILFGMLCAVMTIIPYIGLMASALLPISIIWMQTGNIWYPIGVVVVFAFVQYLEANVIFPKVVGTRLHVSTLAMLVAVMVGGILWGIAGMVLFIPFVAIAKIMTDYIEEWKPLNLLLSRK
jgi:predicted PurR-regulated permease PerM